MSVRCINEGEQVTQWNDSIGKLKVKITRPIMCLYDVSMAENKLHNGMILLVS